MDKPTEHRSPSSPAKGGGQSPAGSNKKPPANKAKPIAKQDGSRGAGKDSRKDPQQPARKTVKPQLRAAKGDDDVMSQEPKKS